MGMTVERMIELLEIEKECVLRNAIGECNRYCAGCDLLQDDTELHEMYTEAIALLKAHEAKRVSVVHNGFTGLPVTHCPKCHRPIDMFFGAQGVSTNFCPWCGQAVKWE